MTQKVTLRSLAAQVEILRRALSNTPRLHVKDVLRRYGISRATLYRRLARGDFTRPVRFCGPIWRLDELERDEAAGRVPGPMSR
ncbi:MAG TPA: hypothetical protein VH280_14800 [Verrucomicrobiae bacterium]|nr:hypothetical protein [Verrucomicrobiae bacterium]